MDASVSSRLLGHLAALVLVACDDDEVREYEDEGTVCLRPSADTLQVRIEFPTCVSSSCDTVLEKSCSAELEGNVLTFHACTKIGGSTGECTADCGLVTADCSLPMPPPGNHLIHFGTNEGLTTRIDMESHWFPPLDTVPYCFGPSQS